MSNGKKPRLFKLHLFELLADSKACTTKIGKVEFDPDKLDEELEVLGKRLPVPVCRIIGPRTARGLG